MAHELTYPLLPCPDIDEIDAFYATLGFERTYRQVRPNPYVALRREDLHLHFFGMPGFDPEQSYGTCLVQVPDVRALWTAFADGMRAAHGKVLVAGRPRMTRPRPRRNDGGVTGFSLVDPGGNWIRVFQQRDAGTPPPADRLARAVENAVVLADSHGDHRQAAKILDGALARAGADTDPAALAEALAYRAELAEVLGDDPGAAEPPDRRG
ncbi:VOC family protein [Spirilliplanes yamanashiensis]|nr:VOC family protein [Spirilliplanes yamanashiensis]MDP9818574.1 catechol 2,3-dioxygenase-like lactoylglutathione lyase family enzyme [Spirilliplanes yamanashiensis]